VGCVCFIFIRVQIKVEAMYLNLENKISLSHIKTSYHKFNGCHILKQIGNNLEVYITFKKTNHEDEKTDMLYNKY
jgi:hypothetical protein